MPKLESTLRFLESMGDCTFPDALDCEAVRKIVSRRDAMSRAGKRGLGFALASLPLGLSVMAKSAFAQDGGLPQEVVDILNFALTLEFLEAEFYELGVNGNPDLIPAEDQPVFDQIRIHENAHVELLSGVLGDQAVEKPEFDFTAGGTFDPFNDYAQFQVLAQGFEDTGVRAYKGQASDLYLAGDDDLLTTALQIHSVEARHASEVRALRGQSRWIEFDMTDVAAIEPVYAGEANTTHANVDVTTLVPSGVSEEEITEAFDEPLTMQEVLDIAGMFIVS